MQSHALHHVVDFWLFSESNNPDYSLVSEHLLCNNAHAKNNHEQIWQFSYPPIPNRAFQVNPYDESDTQKIQFHDKYGAPLALALYFFHEYAAYSLNSDMVPAYPPLYYELLFLIS